MKTHREIIVTTTSSIEGWEIVDYLGMVSAHVVAGTNIFSDLFAGLSDIFGGRSLSYQKQLNAINNEAINLLKQKTLMFGGNLILGARIDHDEISGKGKSMFMVTASGTAVNAHRLVEKQTASTANPGYLDSTELENLIEKKLILSKAKKKKLLFDEETLNFVTDHKIHEIAPYLLEKTDEFLNKDYQTDSEKLLLKKCKEFFLTLDEDKAKFILHEYISRNHNLFDFIIDIIEEANLLDLLKTLELLKSNDFKSQKKALTLLELNKSFYTESDFKIIVNILNIIEKIFPPKAKLIKEKSKLSSKVKEKWVCECGAKNDTNNNYCSSCQRDIYGFKKNEVNPKEIKEVLTHKAIILKEYFNIETNKGT